MRRLLTAAILVSAFGGGCASMCCMDEKAMACSDEVGSKAIAVLHATKGNETAGWVTLEQLADGVLVKAEVTGLSPGVHGFHVHEFGDCSAEDAASAGSHYNPTKMDHGGPTDAMRHMGDLGNLTADADGKASLEWKDPMLCVCSVLGRAVIVHAQADDLKSQPTGNAGGRVACGVIGIAK
jgi:Cu-Zn family superoxide dismutase